jgi:glycosyl hydrolase family 65
MPNWLVLVLRIEGGDVLRLGGVEVLGCRHELNIRYATLIRQFRFRDGSSRETTLTSRRFVSMADVHHAGIEWTLVPEKLDARPGELVGPGSAGVVHGRGLASCRSWWRLVVGRARSPPGGYSRVPSSPAAPSGASMITSAACSSSAGASSLRTAIRAVLVPRVASWSRARKAARSPRSSPR